MYVHRASRPAIFLPGDSRRAPAYGGREAARLERRRASDPGAPDFVRSSWRRSAACMRHWRVGGRAGSTLYLKLYREASFVCLRMRCALESATHAAFRVAVQARQRFIESLSAG